MCVCTLDFCVAEEVALEDVLPPKRLQVKTTIGVRPKLFNWISVLLITAWVVIVSAVAHSVPAMTINEGPIQEETGSQQPPMLAQDWNSWLK